MGHRIETERAKILLPRSQDIHYQPDPPGNGVMVGRVTTAASKIGLGKFLLVNPVTVFGPEVEGGDPILTVDATVSIPVYLVGSTPAKPGDDLLCRFVNFRWVAERCGRSSSGVTISGCPCLPMPTAVAQALSGPQNNQKFHGCNYLYGPTPPNFASVIATPNSYLSVQSFVDAVTGDSFWYTLQCSQGYIAVLRVFPNPNSHLYDNEGWIYRWLVGLPGNACAPFLLSNGVIYPNADPRLKVTLTGPS